MLKVGVIDADPARPSQPQPQPHFSAGFEQDLLHALAERPRHISPKYFYDAAGSALFDRICELPEYYPTRTEVALLDRFAPEIARLCGARAEVVEFGAGSLHKIRLLLAALDRPARYVPIDISSEHLAASARDLVRDHPRLSVVPVAADYTCAFDLPPPLAGAGRRIGFFPGSTIGNFSPVEALGFLRSAAQLLSGGALLLGADLVKDPALLHAAYNDAKGVTAAFNLNLLARANRELGCDFELAQFAHSAFYNAPLSRIEMHLMSRCRQRVRVAGKAFEFEEGETLHTENSYKFTVDSLRALALAAGFEPGPVWTDEKRLFSLHWLSSPGAKG
ncbi:MAG: L-histidine N(alpha)-methyltransferase [Burkholderiales bacterium]